MLVSNIGNSDDYEYALYLQEFQSNFDKHKNLPLFTTNVSGLFDLYLSSFNPTERQFYNCRCCRDFITKYGNLVMVNKKGKLESVIWGFTDSRYKILHTHLKHIVERSEITGVFVSSELTLGNPGNDVWKHYSLKNNNVFNNPLLTPNQYITQKFQDYCTVSNYLKSINKKDLETAITILESGAVHRSEKVLGNARWLLELYLTPHRNSLWLRVASAPEGFCHPQSSMLGSLLEDISNGLSIDSIKNRFNEKMDPLQYQRPSTVSDGNINQAELVIAKLGIESSLERRYAVLEDVVKLWEPKPKNELGIFSHLKTKEPVIALENHKNISFERFQSLVMPKAENIELYLNNTDNYTVLVTANNADSKPIIQWDSEDQRNPVTWYVYHSICGSFASNFGLTPNKYTQVTALTLKPHMWFGNYKHHCKGVIFLIKDIHETINNGNALFPEFLKSELHPYRSTIEAYSRNVKIIDKGGAYAMGIGFNEGSNWNCNIRVIMDGFVHNYIIDRWE